MERALANKVNSLAGMGHDVLIVTTDQRGRKAAYPMDARVRTVDLAVDYEENNGSTFWDKAAHFPFKQLRHRRSLASLLNEEKADIVVSMFCNDASFVPKIRDGSKKVLEVHFSRFKRLQYGRKGLWALSDRLRAINDIRAVSRFDRFVVLTEEDKRYWEEDCAKSARKVRIECIPNARTFAPSEVPERRIFSPKTVLAVGRLSEQKAFDRLIDAWMLISAETRDGWRLKIVGDGEMKEKLKEKIRQGGQEDTIVLQTSSEDIRQEYADADVFALTSRYEGLPMVLLEAQASGLPIVAMACKCGPADVVTDGVDGFLVEEGDVPAFASRLSALMEDADLRHTMGRNSTLASERYDESSIMARWTGLFEDLCAQ